MKILNRILHLVRLLSPNFSNENITNRFARQLILLLIMNGRHTISSALTCGGRDQEDWSSEYRLFSKSKWNPNECFKVIIQHVMGLHELNYDFIPIAVDDFRIRKTGKNIPFTTYQLDPKSPPFHPNLMWGHRYLHFSMILPLHHKGLTARGFPVSIQLAPHVKKPGKLAIDSDWEEYQRAKKAYKLTQQTVEELARLRQVFNELGHIEKNLLLIGDGSYCNSHVFKGLPIGVELIARARKDAKLCFCSNKGRSFYSTHKFTPEEVRKSSTSTEYQGKFFYGGDFREVRYKELKDVYWQKGAGKRPLRLIIIRGILFRKTQSGKKNYRDPIYLLTTDLVTPMRVLIQMYLNRWEIEVNHRDMKNNLGMGEAQVWNKVSTIRHTQFVAIAYSLLLIAAHEVIGVYRDPSEYLPPPKWYLGRKRPSIEDLKRKLRQELLSSENEMELLGIKLNWKQFGLRTAA